MSYLRNLGQYAFNGVCTVRNSLYQGKSTKGLSLEEQNLKKRNPNINNNLCEGGFLLGASNLIGGAAYMAGGAFSLLTGYLSYEKDALVIGSVRLANGVARMFISPCILGKGILEIIFSPVMAAVATAKERKNVARNKITRETSNSEGENVLDAPNNNHECKTGSINNNKDYNMPPPPPSNREDNNVSDTLQHQRSTESMDNNEYSDANDRIAKSPPVFMDAPRLSTDRLSHHDLAM